MAESENLFGIFFKVGFDAARSPEDLARSAVVFRPYVGGNNGLDRGLKSIKHRDYGKDLAFVLLMFYVRPSIAELMKLKEIESYRKTEKSIGIPIVVNDENFFSRTETGRLEFLRNSIKRKLDLLAEVVKKKKLDTNVELLKADVEKALAALD